MKIIPLLAFAFLLFNGRVMAQEKQAALQNFKKIQWLCGNWTRTNGKAGHTTLEQWEKKADTELVGKGIHLKGIDAVFVEKLAIVMRNEALFYVADVPGNKGPVWFTLTTVTDEGFVCENPEHDFPKMISYQLQGKVLKATISGNGRSIDYWFERR